MIKFVIQDESHCEQWGEFESFSEALKELEARKKINWDVKPNTPPCTSWRNCDRDYVIIEYETFNEFSEVKNITPVFSISSRCVGLKDPFEKGK